MYAIYKVLNKKPSGRPEKDWKDYRFRWNEEKGKEVACECFLLRTCGSEPKGLDKTDLDGNEIFYVKL